MTRLIVLIPLLAVLSACGGANRGHMPEASPSEVAASAYFVEGPPTITLLTALRTTSGEGTHSALILDNGQRYIFDPAGSWRHPDIVERGDVLYGMGPGYLAAYYDYYAADDYHLVLQEVAVTQAQADQLARLMTTAGRQSPANCSRSITTILRNTPGFEQMSVSWFPARSMRDFAELPGVDTLEFYDDDPADNILAAEARAELQAELAAEYLQ